MKTYDPNWRNQFPTHVIRLHFQQWKFKTSIDVKVGGNCLGFDNLSAAIDRCYDELRTGSDGNKLLVLRHGNNELMCSDEERLGEDWLAPMLVGFEIIDVQREDGSTLTKKKRLRIRTALNEGESHG